MLIDGPFGIHLLAEEVRHIVLHLEPFGVRPTICNRYPFWDYPFWSYIHPYKCNQIPCSQRGRLPSLQIEFSASKPFGFNSAKANESFVLDINEYVVNLVSSN